jgi:hypothetical protein
MTRDTILVYLTVVGPNYKVIVTLVEDDRFIHKENYNSTSIGKCIITCIDLYLLYMED